MGAALEGKATWKNLCKNWVASYAGNLVGSVLLALLAAQGGTLKSTMAGPLKVAVAKTTQPFMQLFYKGILCNWLVCMAVWCATHASDIGSKALAVFLPISGFVALGLEHSVANMFMIPFGVFNGAEVTVSQFCLATSSPLHSATSWAAQSAWQAPTTTCTARNSDLLSRFCQHETCRACHAPRTITGTGRRGLQSAELYLLVGFVQVNGAARK